MPDSSSDRPTLASLPNPARTSPPARRRRVALSSMQTVVLITSLATGLVTSACELFDSRPPGTIGEDGVVFFQPEHAAVTTVPLMVGSTFTMAAVGNREEDRSKVASGFFVSTNSNVIEVIEGGTLGGEFRVTGAGATTIEVHDADGDRLDAISLDADVVANIELLDSKLVGASVDARLPPTFAIVEGAAIPVFIAAENACGEALLAINGVEVVSTEGGIVAFSAREDPADLTRDIDPLALGTTTLTLDVGDVHAEYDIDVIEARDVDVVRAVPAASEAPTVEFWGRAFADGTEIIGTDFNWSSPNGRVSVSRARGSNVVATVTFPAEGEEEDTRPAEIEVEAYGESDIVDIFTLQTPDLVGERVPPKEVPVVDNPSSGCEGGDSSGTCGALLFGAWGLRRRRKRRTAP